MSNRRAPPSTRAGYRWFLSLPTRWMDNDAYGHVNNVTYYSFFDTAVARFLLASGVLDLSSSTAVGLVVETGWGWGTPGAVRDGVGCCRGCGRVGGGSG